MSPIQLSDFTKFSDADIIALISHIVYEQATALDFPDGDLETLRKLIDELEYRHVISPRIEGGGRAEPNL